ncbi:conserved domain protein [Paenibacillus sp. HGF7]|uniref:conserved domain protein n=1 Tax=Paenibacillus sp. HGF7 TaxID=944559 RepID=UPI00020D6D80|nr:conserved domain protein [Paenibacillus sp. HGF7]EGL16993.1 hypothetical protein HMPREF9413_3670 [Paenibacillus sp. HGF7]
MNYKKKWVILLLLVIVFLQVSFFKVAYRYPYLGILAEQNAVGQWYIAGLEKISIGDKVGFKTNDIVISIDGKDPSEHATVQKYHSIEQADKITIQRDGQTLEFSLKEYSTSMTIDILSLIGEIFAFLFAYFLYTRIANSVSASMLSVVFANIALIFMAIGASTRADILAKGVTMTLVAALPFVFLHFLIMFFKERSSFSLPTYFMKYVYVGLIIFTGIQAVMFLPSAEFEFYSEVYYGTIFIFILGFTLNLALLAYLYIKYRKTNDYLFTVIRTVVIALICSFFPLVFLTFLPRLILKQELAFSYYSGWFVMIFPVVFGYLMMSKQLYDLDILIRRVYYTAFISTLPSGVLVIVNYFIFQKDASLKHLVISFLTTLIVLTFVTYSLEYFATRLEKIMFPRKYYLQQALKKIASDLGGITNFRELRDIVLVDIVDTLQVLGGAIVIQYADGNLEIISEGSIDEKEVRRRIVGNDWFDSDYTRTLIKGHEEYISFLVMTKKKRIRS